MENNIEFHINNDNNQEEIYTFNFINKPWDDRTKESKILITLLLTSIFVVTMAVVIINLVVYYWGYDPALKDVEIDCNLIKDDAMPFAARIYSLSNQAMICLGVVLSQTTILTTGLCLKFTPIHIRLGNTLEPRCKKGFTVDVVDFIPHNASVTKTIALITTKENLRECSRKISIGTTLNSYQSLKIIGRPNRGDKTLSMHNAYLDIEYKTIEVIPELRNRLSSGNGLCVKGLARCPVRVGDILIQENKLFGLACTSVLKHENNVKVACFARLDVILGEIKAIDSEITSE